MKDPQDIKTIDLVSGGATAPALAGAAVAPPARKRAKPKRLPNQSMYTPPPDAKPACPGMPLGFGRSVVLVASVAREWGISPRRVRNMLSEGRLMGRRLENGYWEVYYPYSYIFGTRGPGLKRQQRQPDKPKKPELKAV